MEPRACARDGLDGARRFGGRRLLEVFGVERLQLGQRRRPLGGLKFGLLLQKLRVARAPRKQGAERGSQSEMRSFH